MLSKLAASSYLAAVLLCAAFGVLGIWSGLGADAAGAWWVGAGLLLAAILALPGRDRPIGRAPWVLLSGLAALIAYHAVQLAQYPSTSCGCLHKLGDPSRTLMLAVLSALLMALAWSGALRSTDRQGWMGRWGPLVGVALGIAAGVLHELPQTSRIDADAIPRAPLEGVAELELVGIGGSTPGQDSPAPPAQASEAWVVHVSAAARVEVEAADVVGDAEGGGVSIGPWSEELRSFSVHGAGDLPRMLAIEPRAQPMVVVSVEWNERTRVGLADLRTSPGREVHVHVIDGLGQPVEGVPVVVSETADMRSSGVLRERAREVAAGLRQTAIGTSDRDGQVVVRGWRAGTAYAAPTGATWSLLRLEYSELDGIVIPPAPAPGDAPLRITLRVGRSLRVGVMVEALGVAVEGPPPVSVVLQEVRPPLPRTARSIKSITDPASKHHSGLYVLDEVVVLDSRSEMPEGLAAGVAVVVSPGFRREQVPVHWSQHEGPFPRVSLVPKDATSSGTLSFSVVPPLDLGGSTLNTTATIRDLADDSVGHAPILIDAAGRHGRLPFRLHAGEYEIRTQLATEAIRVAVRGDTHVELPRRTDVATLSIRPTVPDGYPPGGLGVFVTDESFATPSMDLVGSQVVGLRVLGQGRTGNDLLYLLLTGADEQQVGVSIGGLGMQSVTERVVLRRGEAAVCSPELTRKPR